MSGSPVLGLPPPVSTLTPTNQRGVLFIATALGLVFSLVSVVIRGYVRYEFARSFGWDDASVVAAFVFSACQASTVFVQVAYGLGKTISDVNPAELVPMQKASYASDILYIITLWITKCAVIFLFLRLSPHNRHELVSKCLFIGAVILGVVSVFIISLRCDLTHPWIFFNQQCPGVVDRWRVIATFDCTTEAGLLVVPIYILHRLQMSREKKVLISLAFGSRIIILAPAILRLHYISSYIKSSNPTLASKFAVVYTQIELSWAIIAPTIPCLRPFMTATTTWGRTGDTIQDSTYGAGGSNSRTGARTGGSCSGKGSPLSLSGISSRLWRNMEKKKDSQSDFELTEHSQGGWEVEDESGVGGRNGSGPGADQRSMGSSESKQLMIHKDVELPVADEGALEKK